MAAGAKQSLLRLGRGMLLVWFVYAWTIRGVYPTDPYASAICRYISGLTSVQRTICEEIPESIPILRQAVDKFEEECKWQFRKDRWNCTNVTPPILKESSLEDETRESAFVYALASAMAAHQITRACSQGNLSTCSCDTSMNGDTPVQGWQWGSCSDDVKYGVQFAQNFIDARELDLDHSSDEETRKTLINLHNNAAGRRAVEHKMKRSCKCHGFSGSCAIRTCWMELPTIYEIGDFLRQKYNEALEVAVNIPRNGGPAAIRYCNPNTSVCSTPPITELIYLKQSPDYCADHANYTLGRYCIPRVNATTVVSDLPVCEDFCCDHTQYELSQRNVTYSCNCHFDWCCNVACEMCSTNVTEYQCTG